jgi:hypothetical protein
MSKKPKQLGLNYSVFEDFITNNRIYVDKTKHIYNLITAPDIRYFYFISRPRRFGKSLFISTLKEIFLGRKELFNEYWIGQHADYDWPKHPVIHLDFSGIAHADGPTLKKDLGRKLESIAQHYKLALSPEDELERKLVNLVEQLRTINKVVLLIDEYDKPLVDHIDNLPLAEENRKILNNFYTTVKSLDAYWHAIFITGVSKFAKTSLFSGLNNLVELSLDPQIAELFGYTYEELINYFSSYINNFSEQKESTREETLINIKEWYDGYRFSKDMKKPQMYSPLSTVACLTKKEFSNYWFNTGTPGFLIALLRAQGLSLELPNTLIQASLNSLNVLDINNIPLYALLVQTGYLTIVDYDASIDTFTLDYPNREVRESFKYYLMQAFAYASPGEIDIELGIMRQALKHKNFETFCNAIKRLFAGIPYNLHIPQEDYYHSLFHLMFDLLGMRPKSEESTSRGRSDLVLETADTVYVFEFKFDATVQEAMDQIIEKQYYAKYMHKNKIVVLVGINMRFKDKNLQFEWLQQSL